MFSFHVHEKSSWLLAALRVFGLFISLSYVTLKVIYRTSGDCRYREVNGTAFGEAAERVSVRDTLAAGHSVYC
jgi:hypothetical protein